MLSSKLSSMFESEMDEMGMMPNIHGRKIATKKVSIMESVRLNRKSLLETVKTNRAKHATDFVEACVVFHKEAVKELRKLARLAKKVDVSTPEKMHLSAKMQRPQNFLDSYDRVIAMLERSVDEVVELSSTEFDSFVRDEWHWKGQFQASTMVYNNSR